MKAAARKRSSSAPFSALASLRRRRVLKVILLVLVLSYAAVLRLWRLEDEPLWTDEAESAINALTILQHGVPTGHYLGMPVFENTLTRHWPEHPEFEFKDTSYSDGDLATYHGWLPLYAIAASFAISGVTPDEAPPAPVARRGWDEMNRRTMAARVPSVAFGLLFLAAVFLAGREFYGEDAGWAGLLAATVSTTTVKLARQARYYSLTLALTALFALVAARLVRRGRRRDFVLAAVLLVLLFHSNVLAFVGACAAFALLVPSLRGRERVTSNLAVAAAILVAGIVPWALLTGFTGSASDRPMAYSLLRWSDVVTYPQDRTLFVSIAAGTLAWVFGASQFRDRLSKRATQPFVSAPWAFLLLAGWALAAFIAFNVLMPAASYFHSRLTLAILVPALLFGAMLAAATARVAAPRRSRELSVGLLLLLLYSSEKTTFWWPAYETSKPHLFEVIDHLYALDLRPDTRLYADTGVSLPLKFYSGLPVQNIMPVRRSFLETYAGDLVIVESPWLESLSWPEVQRELGRHGIAAPERAARRTAAWFNREVVRDNLERRVAAIHPASRPAPGPVPGLAELSRQKTHEALATTLRESGNPIFRGYDIQDYTTLWQVFFYRFVNPAARMGAGLNYAARARSGEAFVLPGGWTVIRCPSRQRS